MHVLPSSTSGNVGLLPLSLNTSLNRVDDCCLQQEIEEAHNNKVAHMNHPKLDSTKRVAIADFIEDHFVR